MFHVIHLYHDICCPLVLVISLRLSGYFKFVCFSSIFEYCFCFGSVSSFFLELFLHFSPVAYWATIDLGSSSFSVISFCLFIVFMGFSRQEYWSGLPFPFPVDHILSDSWESLGLKEIQPVHPKGDQSWVFTGRTDVEAEAPIIWPPDAKSWLIGKDPDAGKDWGQEEKGMTENEMVGWHHRL